MQFKCGARFPFGENNSRGVGTNQTASHVILEKLH